MIEYIYIVKGLKEPLLGRPAIEKLNLVDRINDIKSQSSEDNIKANCPQIQLKPSAQQFAITTPRRIILSQ